MVAALPDLVTLLLGYLLLCVGLFMLLLARQGRLHLNPSFNLGFTTLRPLDFVWSELAAVGQDVANVGRAGTDAAIADFHWLLREAGNGLISLSDDLLGGVRDTLVYLWDKALPAAIHAAVNVVRAIANDARALATQASRDAANAVSTAEQYTNGRVAAAEAALRAYAATEAERALHGAEGYASEAVAKLRAAEEASIGNVASIAQAAQQAADEALREIPQAVSTAEAAAVAAAARAEQAAVATAEQAASAALAASDAAATQALALVKAIALDAEQGVGDLQRYIDSLGLAGLVAAVPALALLVNTIATDSGLDNQACRSKVKGICGTDANVWSDLLGLLVPVALAFDFKALYEAANAIAGEAAAIVKQAA